MSKKGMRIRDQLPNRHYESWTMNATGTTWTGSTFDTIAGGISPYMAWLIERVEFMTTALTAPVVQAYQAARFQLATGEQTALLNVDDDNVVCTKDLMNGLYTSGAVHYELPVTWIGPILVASRKMTASIDTTADQAPWETVGLTCTVWFKWVEMDKDTWMEVMQARGILT